ncbi:MFS transporter [uncultured Massilia sp.]|uniref:MFS transporter n=1 Tax=uncultured Massilia sp. TaxID=169973 RepID=UPI0026014AC1|nr:MFS transporter [uncultured Massilia sp.]
MSTKSLRHPLLWVPTGYFTMALGYTMLTSVTAIMFKNLGMDNGRAAAYSSMLILAYTIKPLFAPVVEMYRTKKFFVLCTQVLVGLGFAAAALAMGLPDWMAILLPLFWAMSFIGATQDIASDGVYVTSLDTRAQSLYCGVQSLSWNIGPIVASGFLVYLSGRLHTDVFHHDPKVFGPAWMDAWRVIFFIVAAIIVLMALWHVRMMPDGARAANTPTSLRGALDILWDSFVTFFQKRDVWKMVAFAFLFRVSIGLLEKIGPFFMVDAAAKGGLGLSNEQLGIVYGTYGLAAVLLGSLLGGMYVARRGLKRVLFVLCCAVNIPNATFLAMAILLPSSTLAITAGVVIEKFFFGFGSVGFMIYLMQQLAPGKYTTTHYAFGTGLMGLCNMVTGVASGHLQEMMGYVGYFVFVMVATIPSFLATWFAPFHHDDGMGSHAGDGGAPAGADAAQRVA